MTSGGNADLQRAAEISRELLAIADNGDLRQTQSLDAERLQLLVSAKRSFGVMTPEEHRLLREIADLNNQAIGLLEHRQRRNERDLDMLSVGKRAMRAYGAAGWQRAS